VGRLARIPTVEALLVRGCVFDASRGASANALAGVLVSNRQQVVRTDAGGCYLLPVGSGVHRFVTLTVPAQFQPAQRWYYPTGGWRRSRVGADFPLLPASARASRRFRLLHGSDTHVIVPDIDYVRVAAIARSPGDADSPGEAIWRKLHLSTVDREFPSRNELAGALRQGVAASRPDLVVATGDLTHAGTVEQLQHFREAVAASPAPVFSVFGGHGGNQERGTQPRGAGFSRHYERSLPQRGLSRAIAEISPRTSALSRGRPSRERDRHRQKNRQPCRCQRSTVSGRTTARRWLQRRQRSRASTPQTLSPRRSGGPFRVGRVRTARCWRSTRVSTARSARSLTAARTNATRSRRSSRIAPA
jgi:hypothetical protein